MSRITQASCRACTPHQPIIENYGGLGMTWIAACWCGTFRGTYRSEGSARAAHAEHVAGASRHG